MGSLLPIAVAGPLRAFAVHGSAPVAFVLAVALVALALTRLFMRELTIPVPLVWARRLDLAGLVALVLLVLVVVARFVLLP